MKKQKTKLLIISLIIMVVLAACTTQPVGISTDQPASTSTPAVAAAPSETATALATNESTATAAPTATLEPTATVYVEPTATSENTAATPTELTPVTGENVSITLTRNTVCRTGPATNYPSVVNIPAGQLLNAIGKLENDTDYTYIENPSVPGSYCWVFSEGAAVQGSRANLKVFNPLPTPAPESEMDFSVIYSGIQECPGDDYSFNLVVTNTNKKVWQSIKIYIIDANTKKTASYSSDHFEGWTKCHVDWYQHDLTKGEHAFISPYNPGHFDYSPYGGTFFIRVKLCSEEGLGGTCMDKEIKVQP